MNSNYRAMRSSKVQPHWKRLHERGFEHIEVSNEGRVRHSQTLVEYTRQTGHYGQRLFVNLPRAKELGGGYKQRVVAELVYQTFHNCVLPPRCLPEHKNGDYTDCRLVNLKVDDSIHVASVPVVKHVQLPTVKPDTTPKIVQKPPEVDRQAELAARYEARMDELHLALLDCNEWRSAADILRIGIMESEWLYLLNERLTPDEVRDMVLVLIRLLAERGNQP